MASWRRRHVEVRRHVQPATALERQLLDAVARTIERAGNPWIEGSLCGRVPEHLPQFRDDGLLPIDDVLGRRNGLDDASPPFPGLIRNPNEVALQIARIVRQPRAVHVELDAGSAGDRSRGLRLTGSPGGERKPGPGDNGSSTLEEAAASQFYRHVPLAILVQRNHRSRHAFEDTNGKWDHAASGETAMTGDHVTREKYTHGHAPAAVRQHGRRTAEEAVVLDFGGHHRRGESYAERLLTSPMGARAVEYGHATQEDVGAMASAFRAWAVHPDAFWASPKCRLSGEGQTDPRSRNRSPSMKQDGARA
jgi:hypothetical protein